MATDMQRLSIGFPSQQAPGIQDARDRQPAFQAVEPSRNFESMLGRAEARQMPPKHESSTVRNGDKIGNHVRPAAHPAQESSRHPSERSPVAETHDKNMDRRECTGEKTQQSTGESTDKDAAQESKKSKDQEAVPQDILLAAMIVPSAQTNQVEAQPAQAETGATHSEEAVTALAAIPTDGGAEGSGPPTAMAASGAVGDVAAQGLPTRQAAAAVEPGKEATQAKDTAGKPVQTEGTNMRSSAGQIPGSEGQSAARAETGAGARIDPHRQNPALSVMTATKQDAKIVEQAPIDQADRSTVLDAIAQATSVSEGQAGSGAGRFTGQDGQSFSDSSSGTDRSLPNQTSSLEPNTRSGFLDRMNGLNQPAPSVNEGSPGRSESGQTASVLRASESERMNDLRGAAPVSQSVTLDLDPLDMGPLRVRVMMSDQTVHAHIRTEHGELGQGLLQQGQSLESSLRTTGLEMGMLRVTVDQQQGRGDNAWMFQQQQQQGRPPTPNMSQAAVPEDTRVASGERGVVSNERVSFFA
ncbi:MAG: flagellar hook-length control protein FliK [Nitrospira sp.]|nr:flagellar hook-length control protein FliK [Nitrospira sp.]